MYSFGADAVPITTFLPGIILLHGMVYEVDGEPPRGVDASALWVPVDVAGISGRDLEGYVLA